MITRQFLLFISLAALLLTSCGKNHECDCVDVAIQTSFINYAKSDVDTFILRKFKAADNYQTLLDSFTVGYGCSCSYTNLHDTTNVTVYGGNAITAGFDWQIFIPAANKTILLSDIEAEKKTGTYRTGIFSMDKKGCNCWNRVFSAKMNNQPFTFPYADGNYTIYIRN
jgi:hypothetical protein